jgi:4-hydroxy-2-oxoheptanedioate aldolase
MVPMVDDADQAREIVRAAKFPPLGARSYGGRRPIDMLGRGYANPDREQPLLVCQIETPAGLENADAIASVEGVDALFFGPDDMALRLGLPMDAPRPQGCFDDALRRVAEAAGSQGKIAGAVFVNPGELQQGVQLGYRLVVSSADVILLAGGSQQQAQVMRECLAETKAER